MRLNKLITLSITLSIGLSAVEYISLTPSQSVEASTVKYEYIVTASSLNVRSKSSTVGQILGVVRKNTKLMVKKELSNGWLEITYKGKVGYVSGKYVQKKKVTTMSKPSTTTKYEYIVNTSSLNVRSKSSTSGKILGTVKKNTKLTVKKELSNGWLEIVYKGKTGYVSGKYVQKKKVTTTSELSTTTKYEYIVNTSSLNVRSKSSTSGKVLGTVKKNTKLPVKKELSNGWLEITYKGKTGYVSGKYVQKKNVNVPKSETPKPPITEPSITPETYQTVDLRKLSNVTAKEIDSYIATNVKVGEKSKLTGKGSYIIQAGRKYGMNELALAGILIHESAYGKSYLSHFKNNLSGMMAFDSAPYDSAMRFTSIEQMIDYTAQYIYNKYIHKDGTHYNGSFLGAKEQKDAKGNVISGNGMNVKYSSDSNWGKKIAAHMEKIKKFDKEYYQKQAIASSPVKVQLVYPNESDKYPSFAKAVAKAEFGLYTSKDGKYVRKIKKGETFIPLEKTNDFYMKVNVGGKIYWTSKLAFSQYMNFFDFKNIVRVYNAKGNLGSVPVYKNPNGDNEVGKVANFSYLEGVLVNNSMEIINNFYAVKYNGVKVWIAKDYVQLVY